MPGGNRSAVALSRANGCSSSAAVAGTSWLAVSPSCQSLLGSLVQPATAQVHVAGGRVAHDSTRRRPAAPGAATLGWQGAAAAGAQRRWRLEAAVHSACADGALGTPAAASGMASFVSSLCSMLIKLMQRSDVPQACAASAHKSFFGHGNVGESACGVVNNLCEYGFSSQAVGPHHRLNLPLIIATPAQPHCNASTHSRLQRHRALLSAVAEL